MTARILAAASLLSGSLAVAQDPAAGSAQDPAAPIVKPDPVVSPTPTPTPTPTATPARTVNGTVRSVETNPRRLIVGSADGDVTVLLDRNTAVYLERGTGTVRDLEPGAPVRVSVAGPDLRALWIEIARPERAAQPKAAGAPGQAAAAPGESGASRGESEAGKSGTGMTPPVSPGLPPRAPPGPPPGPGPVPGGPVGPDPSTGTAPKQ